MSRRRIAARTRLPGLDVLYRDQRREVLVTVHEDTGLEVRPQDLSMFDNVRLVLWPASGGAETVFELDVVPAGDDRLEDVDGVQAKAVFDKTVTLAPGDYYGRIDLVDSTDTKQAGKQLEVQIVAGGGS